MNDVEILYPEVSYGIMGACFNVYKGMEHGFAEPVYQECMEIELEHLQIPFVAQQQLKLTYRERTLRHHYFADIVCHEKILVELKAVSKLTDEHQAQVINYLHATGYRLGLLINFGHYPKLEYKRIVL